MQKPQQMVAPGQPGATSGAPFVRDQVEALEKRVAALEAKLGVSQQATLTTPKKP